MMLHPATRRVVCTEASVVTKNMREKSGKIKPVLVEGPTLNSGKASPIEETNAMN